MTRIVLLDSGVLGMVTHPRRNADAKAWLRERLSALDNVLVPEIADYEVRRELIRADKRTSLDRLDVVATTLGYVPLITDAMRRAARFWALARSRGRPTASNESLDADVILAAQASLLMDQGRGVVVATTNVIHLAQFVDARRWQDI